MLPHGVCYQSVPPSLLASLGNYRLTSAWQEITRIERESSNSSLDFWLSGSLELLLPGPVLVVLGAAWGIPQAVIYLWSRRLLDGMTIGRLTFFVLLRPAERER